MLQALGTCKTRSLCPPRGISLSSLHKQGEPGHLRAGCGPLTFTERGFVAGMSAQSLIWEARCYLGRVEGGAEHAGLWQGGCRGLLGKGKWLARRGTPAPRAAGLRVSGCCRQRIVGTCLGWEMLVKWGKDAQVRASHTGALISAGSTL